MAYDAYLSRRDLRKLARGKAVKIEIGGEYKRIAAPRGGLKDYD